MEQLAEQETKQEHGNFNVVLISIQPNTNIIGVKYLHAYLQKNGITSRILILPSYNETMNNTVEKFFNKYKPNLVGLGILTEEFPIITKLTKFLKQKFDFATCMGGYQATIDPKWLPLEIGSIKADQFRMRLLDYGGVARWSYGDKHIYLFNMDEEWRRDCLPTNHLHYAASISAAPAKGETK